MLRTLLSRVEKLEAEGKPEGTRLLWANAGESSAECRARHERETGCTIPEPALVIVARWSEPSPP